MAAFFLSVPPSLPHLSAAPTSTPPPEIVLSSTVHRQDEKAEFPCSGKVYALFTAPEKRGKDVKMEGFWYRPDGQLQESAEVSVPGGKPAHLWLQFKAPPARNLLEEFTGGGAESPFQGAWTLEIRRNGAPWARRQFAVKCLQE